MAMSRVIALAFLCAFSVSVAVGEGLGECIQGENCHLPDCFCPTFSHPMGAKNIPQIVYFGFDDAVTPEVSGYFRQLFTEDRQNVNGCPITMSLYVCHRYTIYSLVSEFYSELDEIAVHSVTHTFITDEKKLRWEASQQRQNIEYEANVPGKEIIGWRSPDLITAGDIQPRVLKELNFTYDISLPFEEPGKYAFPFTLDYGYPYGCSVRPCPSKDVSHPGFWEVPINAHWDPVSKIPCCYVDGCRPASEEAAYEFLMSSFLASYNGERAPFGLNMHAAWFYFPMYLSAMDRFIQDIVDQYPDAYIVSTSQMMAWMKNPQTIEQSRHFKPWDCPIWKEKQDKKAATKAAKVPELKKQDLSEFVDPRLSLSTHQNLLLRNIVEKSPIKSSSNKERTDLSKYVDPRLSLNIRQNWFLRHKVVKSPIQRSSNNKRNDLSKYVDPRLSLNIRQNWFLRHKASKPKLFK